MCDFPSQPGMWAARGDSGFHSGTRDVSRIPAFITFSRHQKPPLATDTRIAYIDEMSRIQVNPEIHFGKPCVAGMRIPVQAVLELVREAIPFDAIIREYYPDLTKEDIQACIQYAIDVVQTEDIHVGAPS